MKNKVWYAIACAGLMALSACSTTKKTADYDSREPSSERDWGRGGRHGGRWRGESDLPRGRERVMLGQVRLGDEGRGFDGDVIDVRNFSRQNRNVECGLTHLRLKAVNDAAYIAKIEVMYRNGNVDAIDLRDDDDRGGNDGWNRGERSGEFRPGQGRPGDGRMGDGGRGEGRGDGRGDQGWGERRPNHGDQSRDGVFIGEGMRSEWLDVDDVERERGDRDGRPDGRCIDKIRIFGMSGRRDRRSTRVEVIGYAVGRGRHGGWGGRDGGWQGGGGWGSR